MIFVDSSFWVGLMDGSDEHHADSATLFRATTRPLASFALMRHFAIHEAFAFDGDFAAAGFVELRP